MNFFAPGPLLDERALLAIGLVGRFLRCPRVLEWAQGPRSFKLIEPIRQNGVEGEFKQMEHRWRGQPGCRHGTEPVYGCAHH